MRLHLTVDNDFDFALDDDTTYNGNNDEDDDDDDGVAFAADHAAYAADAPVDAAVGR
jgi:hypothetical protein